jgi:hypothetical protein
LHITTSSWECNIYFSPEFTANDGQNTQKRNGKEFLPILFRIRRFLRFSLLLVARFSGNFLPRISPISRMEDPPLLIRVNREICGRLPLVWAGRAARLHWAVFSEPTRFFCRDGRIFNDGICRWLIFRGFRSSIMEKAGGMAEEPVSAKCIVRSA